MKKAVILCLIFSMLQTVVHAEYEWAKTAVDYCVKNDILHGMEGLGLYVDGGYVGHVALRVGRHLQE